eukprot:TRINITY_DN6796_c0_g1_i4.p2 TRINITY_DN6796_c0_g1~~TRINITY_DN6796_c0_g1_i4.p2  ORF type:complete len:253 (-),score=27.00 TRINITY_DN6796_c0_g1_i4:41-799(-)
MSGSGRRLLWGLIQNTVFQQRSRTFVCLARCNYAALLPTTLLPATQPLSPLFQKHYSAEAAEEIDEDRLPQIEDIDKDHAYDYEEETIQVDAAQVDDSLKLVNCGLSNTTLKALEQKGITALFPIQKHVFQPAMEGRDLLCRAKTGSGKTLAFALPVIENLIKEDANTRPERGRPPRCVILAPTRELAKQVEKEFASAAPFLKLGVFYGGVSINNQITELRRGVDVVVGTPGRTIDLLERLQNVAIWELPWR